MSLITVSSGISPYHTAPSTSNISHMAAMSSPGNIYQAQVVDLLAEDTAPQQDVEDSHFAKESSGSSVETVLHALYLTGKDFSTAGFQRLASLSRSTWSKAPSFTNPFSALFKERTASQADCAVAMATGTLATLSSGHPLPVVLGAAACLPEVSAWGPSCVGNVGRAISQAGKDAGGAISQAGKDAGGAISQAGKDAGGAISQAGKDAGGGISRAGKDAGGGISRGFKDAIEAFRNANWDRIWESMLGDISYSHKCQKHIILKPGETFKVMADYKIALCKSGQTAWSADQSCNYHGPAMHVKVISRDKLLYDGPFHDSQQWFGQYLILKVTNTNSEESAMYVHAQ